MATMRGAVQAEAGDERAKLLEGRGGVRSVAANPKHGIVALQEDGTIGTLDAEAKPWARPVPGAQRLLVAREDGAIVGSRATIAFVSGRFLPGGGRQLAIASYPGRLAVVDEASGRVEFEAAWAGIRDLSATDLDGDGRDDLLVVAGRSVTALGAATD
jgi:hypothetical protein